MTSSILIVEDEFIVSMEIQERLTDLGYRIAGAADTGERALDLISRQRPDLVLMDIRLKGEMDGITAAEEIRSRFHLPVIFLTAYSEDSTLERAKLAEPYGYILKPFDGREIKSSIEIALYRYSAELALHKSEKKYRIMMETTEDAVYICSADFTVEYMNPAMIMLVGHDVTGERCYQGIHSLNEKCPWCVHQRVMQGEIIKKEVTMQNYGKTYHITNTPIRQDDGAVSKLTIFHDITEVEKMTERLQQTQRMDTIGTLAGGIAHDFNNILFPLLGYTEILKEEIPSESPLQEHIDEAMHAALRRKDLVGQILAFSRMKKENIQPVYLHPIIKEALKLLRASIPSMIDIAQTVDSDCGLVLADPTQIHQIIMNLGTNAFHAMEEKGGTLGVYLRKVALVTETDLSLLPGLSPGQYALLTVSDTGVGIEKDIMDKIFDPFFTTKDIGKGTGLGLSVVHGIVKSCQGEVVIDSEPGVGTTVRIYLPIQDSLGAKRRVEQELEPVPGGTERILLVDDEGAIARLAEQVLQKLGYHVAAYTESQDAMEAFRKNPDGFDLVITDLAMPRMTGSAFANRILLVRPDIPVIMWTGFSEKIDEETAKALGLSGLLLKPIVRAELAKMIRRVLDDAKKAS
jgi:PAS domain S-box-containing protein